MKLYLVWGDERLIGIFDAKDKAEYCMEYSIKYPDADCFIPDHWYFIQEITLNDFYDNNLHRSTTL